MSAPQQAPSNPGPHVVEADAEQLDVLLASGHPGLTVLYMWGPDCPNCVVFARRLPVLLERLADAPVRVIKVDVYAQPQVARRYGVYGIPHFQLFRGGKRIGKMSEFGGDAFWLAVVREHLPGAPPAPA